MRTGPFLSVLLLILPATAPGQIVINEIMYDPLTFGRTTTAEYVELYNRNAVPVKIAGWKIFDGTGTAQATLPVGSPQIAPQGYLVIASDTTIYLRFPDLRDSSNVVLIGKSSFSLNLDEDEVVLRTGNGVTVDSLHYDDNWQREDIGETKGIALERISATSASTDERNWSSSAASEGGTPGGRNSLEIPVSVIDAVVMVDPPVVSPDDDGFEDFTRISFRLPISTARIVATIYDRYGRSIRLLANNELAAAQGELIWDGRDDDGRPLSIGFYLVRVEAYDDGGGGLRVAQAMVVVARKL